MYRAKKVALVWIFLAGMMLSLQAQDPPKPPVYQQGMDPGTGGGAPIGSGLEILMILGGLYASRKILRHRKAN